MKTFIVNKKAYRDYEILEKIEAGIKLYGYEVRAIKEMKGSLRGSYVKLLNGKPALVGFNLPKYSKMSGILHYDPIRTRELLLKKTEIKSFTGKTEQKGFTLVPLKIYATGSKLKVLIGLGRGKQKSERKSDIIKKQQDLNLRKQAKYRAV